MGKWLIESENESQIIWISDSKSANFICWTSEAATALHFDNEQDARAHLKKIGYEGHFKVCEHSFEWFERAML